MKEILLSKSFVGSWGFSSEKNIPHEIINRFKSDSGEIYIYVPPYGGYSSASHKVEYLLITGDWHDSATEVLYLVKDLTLLHRGGKDARNYPSEREKLKKTLDSADVRYGGTLLTEIPMTAEGDGVEQAAYFATFRAGSVRKPKKPLFLSWAAGDGEHTAGRDVYALKSGYKYQRQYGFIREGTGDYATVSAIIENGDLWEDAGLNKLELPEAAPQNPAGAGTPGHVNFLNLIHKERDETVFTNLLYEAFGIPGLFADFAEEVLKVPGAKGDGRWSVSKEVTTTPDGKAGAAKKAAETAGGGPAARGAKGRIDLLAEGEKSVIVIENKIDSGLHGADAAGRTQLTTYIEYAERDLLRGREGYYFLLHPDYNDVNIAGTDRERGSEFGKVAYSEIRDFMRRHRGDLEAAFGGETARDFLEGLDALSLSQTEESKRREKETEREIRRRFIGAIRRAGKADI